MPFVWPTSSGRRSQRRLIATLLTSVALSAAPANVARADEAVARGVASSSDLSGELRRLVPKATRFTVAPVGAAAALSDGDRVQRFQQWHDGLPVLGRGATVHLRSDAHVVARAHFEEQLPPRSELLRGDETRARRALAARLRRPIFDAGQPALWPSPAGTGARYVYAYEPRWPGLPFAPVYLVDAVTGELLVARDAARSLGAEARVFDTNPLRSPGAARRPLPLPPSGKTLASDRVVARSCVDRGAVTPRDRLGIAVRVCDLEAVATADAEGNFLYSPDDAPSSPGRHRDAFAESSLYFHTTRVLSFFEQLAPPALRDAIVPAPTFIVVANLELAKGLTESPDFEGLADPALPLVPFSNAFYSPPKGLGLLYGVDLPGLWFGQGPLRDYAYDGDVVYHEFSHAVIDATLGLEGFALDAGGLSAAPGALNEGLADLFSAALSGDGWLGEYAAGDVANQSFVRNLVNVDGCPDHATGEGHFDSTAISGALWTVRGSLPEVERVVFDRTLLELLFVLPRSPRLRLDAFLEGALDFFGERSSVAASRLAHEVAVRGLMHCDRTLDVPTDGPLTSPVDALGPIGFWSPGTRELGVGFVPGSVTFRVALPGAGAREALLTASARAQKGGALFGGGGEPFTPLVLVSWDEPMRYTGTTHNATLFDTKFEGGVITARVAVPERARVAYVQIANTGESGGIYDDLRVAVSEARVAPTPVRGEGEEEPADEAPPPSGCRSGPAPTGGTAATLALAAFAVTLRRARRRRTP